jgi:hypothetical protein
MYRVATALVGISLLSPLAAPSQDDPWAIPAGKEAVPPRPAAPDVTGPIVFTEPELPVGTVIHNLALTTLNGTPIGATTTFGFTVGGTPSTDCTVNLGPPPQTFVNPPGIEGDAVSGAQLTVNFGLDVDRVAFGFAFSCGPPQAPSMTVTALDSGGGTVGSVTVPAISSGGIFVENQVQLAPGLPFRSVRVDVSGSAICTRFLMDNLAYPPLVTPVELQGFAVE